MLSNDLKQILMLHPVRINWNIGKHRRDESDDSKIGKSTATISVGSWSGSAENRQDDWVQNIRTANVWDGIPFTVRRIFNSKFKRKVVEAYIKTRLLLSKKAKDPAEVIFGLKNSLCPLDVDDSKMEEVKEVINKLEQTMQRSALNAVKDEAVLMKAEAILSKSEFNHYQPEAAIIEFIKQSEKGLCLTEIDEFDRVIPDSAVKLINKADTLKVFDNY